MRAERLEQWAHACKAEGRAEGEALALQKLLAKRFGVVPSAVTARIGEASGEQIDAWLERVLDAATVRRPERATLLRKTEYVIVLSRIDDPEELTAMLAERLEQWAHACKAKGWAEGWTEGWAEGKPLALQGLLEKRFGVVPSTVATAIAAASGGQIDAWLERVCEAATLADVFAGDGR